MFATLFLDTVINKHKNMWRASAYEDWVYAVINVS